MIILYRDALCPFLSMTNAIYAIDRAHAGDLLVASLHLFQAIVVFGLLVAAWRQMEG
jgi:hypothetical protein